MKNNILILGISGMLGSELFKKLSNSDLYNTFGTVRSVTDYKLFNRVFKSRIIVLDPINNLKSLSDLIKKLKPLLVINCIGIIKQSSEALDITNILRINAIFPHELSKICSKFENIKLLHFSTDCVFSGNKGFYNENDIPDTIDLYGTSKRLGEILNDHSITIRTSIIGHELKYSRSLIDWFLSQTLEVKGYKNAIFSGLPTYEIADIILNFVIPNLNINGIYNISSSPISKYDLLKLVADIYKTDVFIKPDYEIILDRSLDSSKFQKITGYTPKSWPHLIEGMYQNYLQDINV